MRFITQLTAQRRTKEKKMSKLNLVEMLWELNPNCNKNCSYCGSKEVMNKEKEKDDDFYKRVVEQIIAYPPKEITLTGGEPTICKHYLYVVDELTKAGIKVKIVSNGTVFDFNDSMWGKLSQIGLSVNLPSEIEDLKKIKHPDSPRTKHVLSVENRNRVTMITNFGTHNIWDFDALYNFFVESGYSCWQIQLTMGEYQLNQDGIEHLRKKIEDLNTQGLKSILFKTRTGQTIVMSDNLQYEHECTAGINSCSITWDGNVVPCLSERAWLKDLRVQGNLMERTLKDIWESEFKEQRFGCTKCCRDCIKYKQTTTIVGTSPSKVDIKPIYGCWEERKFPNEPIVIMYGVFPADPKMPNTIPNVVMYGVTEAQVFMYGAFGPGDSTGWTYTTTNDTYSTNINVFKQKKEDDDKPKDGGTK
jgi:MoaA/NifB/PqqE/SkfB family radical SAM enzyme